MPAFLTDWTFWSFLAAGVAIWLSQVSPVRLWFKQPKIDLEIQSSVYVTHLIGIPHFQVYVSLLNSGGSAVRVRSLQVSVARNEQEPIILPVQGVFPVTEGSKARLFVPFTLRPGDEWTRNCNFFGDTTRKQERQFRESKSALLSNIRSKIRIRDNVEKMAKRGGLDIPVSSGLIEAEAKFVKPFIEEFDQIFSLVAGEYKMNVSVVTDLVNVSNDYGLTIFESDENDLRRITEDYKYGTWIYWDDADKEKFIRIPILAPNMRPHSI